MDTFPVFYCGNLSYYRSLLHCDQYQFEVKEHFVKQTLRNRMEILGPNGIQKLIIPTVKTGQRRPIDQVEISYAENWQKDHWKSLEAAYRRSPYFEFFESKFWPFYQEKEPSLLQFNLGMHDVIMTLLKLDNAYSLTEEYFGDVANDHRQDKFLTGDFEAYTQVFSDRHEFKPNLSILDALFCIGPKTPEYLIQ